MAGRSGNQGSRAGGVGAVGGSLDFVPVLPDRVDLPFVTATDGSGNHIWDDVTDVARFPDNRWSAEWRAWYALSEYVRTDWQKISVENWKEQYNPITKKAEDPTKEEIKQLVVAARDERADALGEIVAQHQSFANYFFALMTADPALYPKTNLLMNIASIVAAFTVLYFKNGADQYDPRPRPSQVCPALLPPVPVPGHPSYPSGHATEAHLIELVLNEVFSISTDNKFKTSMSTNLGALAARIARNREIAGLHYPSDSKSGKKLAADIHTLLKSALYKAAISEAQKEWGLP